VRALQVTTPGGPEVLRVTDVRLPEPGPGQVRIRVAASGVNFLDVYHRSGTYQRKLPFILGTEAAGTVDALGQGVEGIALGDRVASERALGSHAEAVVVDAERAARVPDDLDLRTAAAVMLQGLTAHFLATGAYPLTPDRRALVHAGAGGVGRLLVQVAKLRGATVFATASSGKLAAAKAAGADAVIDYTTTDFADEVLALTDGHGVDVVYDSVGRDTFDGSLRCLARFGCLALFGQTSGPARPLDPRELARGSLYLTRPGLPDYVATPAMLRERASEVFAWVRAGELDVAVAGEYPLEDAASGYRELESRKVIGKVLLVPSPRPLEP
jgi:NADPH:quinone reductase